MAHLNQVTFHSGKVPCYGALCICEELDRNEPTGVDHNEPNGPQWANWVRWVMEELMSSQYLVAKTEMICKSQHDKGSDRNKPYVILE